MFLIEIFKRSEEEVVVVIRKQLCPAIRDLLEHGMNNFVKHFVYFTSLGCYPRSSRAAGRINNGKLLLNIASFYNTSFHK